jgi:plastocyanin
MRSLLAVLAVLAVAVAGCGSSNKNAGSSSSGGSSGSSSSSSGGGGGAQLALAAPADGSIKFDKTSLSAKAGTVTINFDNPSSTPHGVAVEGNGVDKDSQTIQSGKTSLTVALKPGTYTFYCPVPGHRAQGMEGKLVVK